MAEKMEVQVNPLDIDQVAELLRKVYHDIQLDQNEQEYLASVIESNNPQSWSQFYNKELSDLDKEV